MCHPMVFFLIERTLYDIPLKVSLIEMMMNESVRLEYLLFYLVLNKLLVIVAETSVHPIGCSFTFPVVTIAKDIILGIFVITM